MIKRTCHYLSFVSSSQLSTRRRRHRRYQRTAWFTCSYRDRWSNTSTTGAVNGQTTLSRSTLQLHFFTRTTYTEEYDTAEIFLLCRHGTFVALNNTLSTNFCVFIIVHFYESINKTPAKCTFKIYLQIVHPYVSALTGHPQGVQSQNTKYKFIRSV